MSTKYVFVTGGVSSALGKGITAATIATLTAARGYRSTVIKLDGYLNSDPGTLNPREHGEVYVTTDGVETDLDVGHYERFLGRPLPGTASVTAGRVWSDIIAAERAGKFLGKTVQVVPHVTDEIKRRVVAHGQAENADLVVVEVGGTVGDIESLAFLEAIRQLRREVGGPNVCYVHVALVPWLPHASELKTKPTQHAVAELRSHGISPDVLVCRSDRPLPDDVTTKIAVMCDVDDDAVISAVDAASIYTIPLALHREGLDTAVLERLQLDTAGQIDLDGWRQLETLLARQDTTRRHKVGIVGKYTELPDAYLSVYEAVRHAAIHTGKTADVVLIDAADVIDNERVLDDLDAIIVPGGFGSRAVEGKVATATYAATRNVPYLGICLGMQAAVIAAARTAGLESANSTEADPATPHPVVALMDEQQQVTQVGGTMRLGAYDAVLEPGSVVANLYGELTVSERHRHRYEVNPAYHQQLSDAGLRLSGMSPDGKLVEFIELPDREFFVATQAHPEFTSTPTRPHPLFVGLLNACRP